VNTNAFIEAQKPNGRHHGLYNRYRSESIYAIRGAIRSLKIEIGKHQAKLDNPTLRVSNFDQLSAERQQWYRDHWTYEIDLFQEQIDILEGIVEQRST